eukprot:m.181796 g.181796  ORF g.181796 m.181796 type:complete len:218 (+) comp16635_c0_seq1:172-825(+)
MSSSPSRLQPTVSPSPTKTKTVKLILIGDTNVGKTNIMHRFTEGQFFPSFIQTIGIDFKVRTVEKFGEKIKMQIWDTAGQERFRSICTAFFKKVQAVVLVFDVACLTSFQHVSDWIKLARKHCHDDIDMILVGNKCDLKPPNRKVSIEEAEQLAKQHNLPYFETSALNDVGIHDAFDAVLNMILIRGPEHLRKWDNSNQVSIQEESPLPRAKKCCSG